MTTGETWLPSGPNVALATPVHEDGTLDEAGLQRLVQRVVDGGIAGICPTGSTGETARLTPDQRAEICRRVRELAPAGMPVIPGVALTTLSGGHAELDAFGAAGATAALVAPPYYYPMADESVLGLYQTLADRSPIPLVLYNIPMFTKVTIAPTVVAELAGHPNVAGIKDSSQNMVYHQELLRAAAGAPFSVLTGADPLLVASLTVGAAGTIAGSANLCPDLVSGICRAMAAGDLDAAQAQQRRLAQIVATCRTGILPAGWKVALELAGVCSAHLVPPGSPLPAADRERIAAMMATEGLAAPAAAAAG